MIWRNCGPGADIFINSYRRAAGPCMQPEPARDRQRIDLDLLPPSGRVELSSCQPVLCADRGTLLASAVVIAEISGFMK
jgi:hypothetical protein